MKLLTLIVLCIVLIFMIFGYFQSKTINEIKLNEANNGCKVQLGIGQKLTISLPSNPSTGNRWELKDKTILKILNLNTVEWKDDKSGLLGAQGERIFRFEAKNLGSIGLNLIYWRPWEKESKSIRKYSITIQVLSKL